MECKYGPKIENATIKRRCLKVNGSSMAKWDKVDLSFCMTKDKDTEILLDLAKVVIC